MSFLSEHDKQRILAAVENAENQSSGEFVTVIARQADQYLYIPTLWAAILSLLTPAVVMTVHNSLDYQYVYVIQLCAFFALGLLFRWQPITLKLIPKAVKLQRAKRLAWEQFFARGLHHTRERNGVLFFVCVAERYVEIIADKGINEKVDQAQWDKIVSHFTDAVKKGNIADGFVSSISACGELLKSHFPRQADDTNELSNLLVEI